MGCPADDFSNSSDGSTLVVSISIGHSGTAATDDSARDAYKTEVGRYGLGKFVGTGGFWTVGYEAAGKLTRQAIPGQ